LQLSWGAASPRAQTCTAESRDKKRGERKEQSVADYPLKKLDLTRHPLSKKRRLVARGFS